MGRADSGFWKMNRRDRDFRGDFQRDRADRGDRGDRGGRGGFRGDRDRSRERERDWGIERRGPPQARDDRRPLRAPTDRHEREELPVIRPEDLLPTPQVDRTKSCPFLLRVYTKENEHHTLADFAQRGKEPVDDEVQIYTWPDATLREITDLIKGVNPSARKRDAKLSFAFIFPDSRGQNAMKKVGVVYSCRKGRSDDFSLASLRFVTGDFIDVAISTGGRL
eukprot:GILI01001150.1.p1 GENE.GILI01001150.1~~GILI01001150.1.p1  ORF type:complete len:222 (+),score=2.94 GILI01001150.1:362-1027(+)